MLGANDREIMIMIVMMLMMIVIIVMKKVITRMPLSQRPTARLF